MNYLKKTNKIRFGISARVSLAVGIISVIVALTCFWLATRLNKVLTIATVLEKNWVIADNVIIRTGEDDMVSLLQRGRAVYDGLTDDEKADPADEAYRSSFDVLRGPEYDALLGMLKQSVNVPGVTWADVRFKDEENDRYVYLMHTEAEADGTYGMGYWEYDDDDVDSVIIGGRDDEEPREMEYLPGWIVRLSERLPASASYVPHAIDHLLAVNERDVANRFSVLYPIRDQVTGDTVGYLSIGEYYANYRTFGWAYAVTFAAFLIPWLIIIMVVAGLLVNREVTRPIRRLARAAVEYGDEEDRQHDGEHFKKVVIPSQDEILLLRDSMSDMEGSLFHYMNNLREMTAREERVRAEMDLSAQIQKGMLPELPGDDAPDMGFDVHAFIRPAREVGGDFYDYFVIDDDHVGLIIADVSGKGMPAALFVMLARFILAAEAKNGTSVAEVMRKANDRLCDNNPEMLFVTVWFGVYCISDRTIRHVNAGHNYPAVYRADEGRFSMIEEEHDMAMGLLPDQEYNEKVIALDPGDKFFQYTDGINEADDPNGELFGLDRMVDALDSHADLSGDALLNAVDADVREFVGEAEQSDDMTMLLLEIR